MSQPKEMLEYCSVLSPEGRETGLSLNPVRIIRHLWHNRNIIFQLTWRDVVSQYKGSLLDMWWSFIQPFFLLLVYTLVFAKILRVRMGVPNETPFDYALYMFCGIIPWMLLSEPLGRASALILNSPHLVKKVVFPLHLLPITVLLASVIRSLFSLVILFIVLLVMQKLQWTVVYLPVVYIPVLLFTVGLSWLLSSLGVFIRDLNNLMGILLTAWMLLTPIFYPMRIVPKDLQVYIRMNPMSNTVEDFRRCILEGLPPDWTWYLILLAASFAVAVFGFWWFSKTRKGFADVI
ncbi:MAG: ABC transporter permease [Deltaproteobacteria bacterium]|nr:ABC transporter permease [Deltaproteobacteria bacterium]MBW2306728.1 ABC transporter permease [Deltaproteobacteria bacterium]